MSRARPLPPPPTREQLAAMLDDPDVSDDAITRAIVDPMGEFEALGAEALEFADPRERAEMVAFLDGLAAGLS